MNFTQIATLYVCAVPVFFAIDMLWLGFVAKSFYRSRLGDLLLTDFNWVAGFSFYFLYIVGILVFAVLPALEVGSLTRALVLGAFFGFVAYATYDLTNLATLRSWSLTISLVDMAWGAVLTGSVSTLVYLIGRKLFF